MTDEHVWTHAEDEDWEVCTACGDNEYNSTSDECHPGAVWTVKHYNSTTGRWHVEEGLKGSPWSAEKWMAMNLAAGYIRNGFDAEAICLDNLGAVENLPNNGSLVEVAPSVN
jgi:hypothetical protein